MSGFFLIDTREGNPSLGYLGDTGKIHLHSTYAPLREATQFIASRKEDIAKAKVILVYGLGLGYHLQELEKYRSSDAKVYVLEMNPQIVPYTERIFSFSEYQRRGFSFFVSDDLQQVHAFLSDVVRECDPDEFLLLVHQPSLKAIPEKCAEIKNILINWETQRESFDLNAGLMEGNFQENSQDLTSYYSLKPFLNRFIGLPMVIVSAGPSLSKNVHLLKELKGKALIIAVGRVARLLEKMDIRPDCLVISDPHQVIWEQVENLEMDVPLFCFPTIFPRIVREYKGPKILLLQNGFQGSEDLAAKYAYPLLETGGSVATTAVSLALALGGNPIIFVGQDLAYSKHQRNLMVHAQGCGDEELSTEMRQFIWVPGNDGDLVPTVKNLFVFLKWMENTIHATPQVRFINATEGGAYIAGTQVQSLRQVLDLLEQRAAVDVTRLVADILSEQRDTRLEV